MNNIARFNSVYGKGVMCAAVCVIWTVEDEILLIKRAVRQGDPWSGHIGFPGGREEECDMRSPLETAMRETYEEIGVKLSKEDNWKQLTPLLPDKDFRGYKLELWPFLFKLKTSFELKLDKSEVQNIIRLPINQLLNHFDLKKEEFSLVSGERYHLPCLKLSDGQKVWGLTLMILTEVNKLYRTS